MANLRLATAARNVVANAVTALVDAGAGAGTLKVYSGAQPATANDAITGTLLLTFALTDPAAAAAVAGVASFDLDPDLSATAAATGSPTHFRVADSTGATVFDGDAGAVGKTLTLPASLTAGDVITLTTGFLTTPAGT